MDCHLFQSKQQNYALYHCVLVRYIQNTPPTSPQYNSLPLIPLRCNMECFMCILEPTAVRTVQLFLSKQLNKRGDGAVYLLHLYNPLLAFSSPVPKSNLDDILLHYSCFVLTSVCSLHGNQHTYLNIFCVHALPPSTNIFCGRNDNRQ